MSEFLESLNEFMNAYKLNNSQLSKMLGVSSTAVNGYFNYGYLPNLQTAIKMCEIFGCSLDYLFGISDETRSDYLLDKDSALDNFNNRLDNLIQERNTTIIGTMKDLELDEYTYYHWKHGKMPKMSNIITIAKYFDVSIDSLVGKEKHDNK